MNKINRVILCLIDNLRSDHLFHFVEKGLLPNIKKLMENGIYSKNCITDFPPITYPTQISMLTGTYTGDYKKEYSHGVPLMNWMGRDIAPPFLRDYMAKNLQIYKLSNDIGRKSKTIFEMAGEENTASIGEFIKRGADYFFPERVTKLALYYLALGIPRDRKKMMIRTDSGIIHKLIDIFKKPKRYFKNPEVPIVSVLWFMTPDILLHFFGYDSQIYKLNIMHIDKVIGVLLDALKRMGYLNDTAIAVVSDHGNYGAQRRGEISNFFRSNLLTHYHPRKNLKGNMSISKYDGVGFFNFKGNMNITKKNSWPHPTIKEMKNYGPKKIDLLQELFKIKGSHLMYHRDENNTVQKGVIHLQRKIKGSKKIISGTIEYAGIDNNYKTKYIMDNDGNDIFGYLNDEKASKLLDNKFHTIQEWLSATYNLDYPLYPDLIPRHFKNPRSSDIILSNDGSVVYNLKNGKGGNKNIYNHDRGIRDCMNVPLIIGGSSDIPRNHVPFCKTTDIVPTLLNMLGKKPHKSVVGQSLV